MMIDPLMGGFPSDSIEQFQEDCRKPREPRTKKEEKAQEKRGKELAKEHGFDKQPKEKVKEAAEKGGKAKREKKPECKDSK